MLLNSMKFNFQGREEGKAGKFQLLFVPWLVWQHSLPAAAAPRRWAPPAQFGLFTKFLPLLGAALLKGNLLKKLHESEHKKPFLLLLSPTSSIFAVRFSPFYCLQIQPKQSIM